MEFPDYPSNSNKSKTIQYNQTNSPKSVERKQLNKIVQGSVTTQKKTVTQKLISQLIHEDIKDIRIRVVDDIIKPTASKMVYDAFTSALGMVLGIDSSKKKNNGYTIWSNSTPYYSYSNRPEPVVNRRKDVYEYNNIAFSQRMDAERILKVLKEEIIEYGSVSVGQLFGLAGQNTIASDFDYGWTSLTERNSGIVRNRDGSYSLDLPSAVPLNN